MKIPVYNNSGEQIKEIELPSRLFAVKPKTEVIHQVVMAQTANARQNLAHTQTKGEVRGGGRKPWRQKGTGRARHGSSRSPLWKGGGVTFGPRNTRNFFQAVNKKQKQLALAMCLSDKMNNKLLTVFDQFKLSGKTKELNSWLKNISGKIAELKNSKKFLLILSSNDKKIIGAAKNLKNVNTILADSLNCLDLLKYDTVLIDEPAIKKIDQHYHKVNSQKLVPSPSASLGINSTEGSKARPERSRGGSKVKSLKYFKKSNNLAK